VEVVVIEARALGLPTATVTLLATAIDRARPAGAVTDVMRAHRVVHLAEVDPDVVVATFADPGDAIAAAVEASRHGATADRVLAVLAIGRADQVLVSGAAAAAVGGCVPDGQVLVDRGFHRLRDLGRPERVWQLTADHIAVVLSDLGSMGAFRHNVPAQVTPLIGRRADVRDVDRLLSGERLVTITGAGGVGKTRVASAVAAAAVDRFPGGIWWVELAAVTTGSGVTRTVLAMLGASEAPGVSGASQLAAALGEEPSLLVLDNCEHLVDDCSELVAGLLAANPSVTVLTTSREPLGVSGEMSWRLRSLASPTAGGLPDGSALYRSDAVRLFVDRAVRSQPALRVGADDARAISQICRRLDGIPLAIELASARCRYVSPMQINRELDERFRVLTGGSRSAVGRQQTLAASVAWSHDRLDDAERRAFRRLGVFAGPFPIEAAQAVVAGLGDIESEQVAGLVTRLADKNLVVAEEGVQGEARYRLLETLRAFATERATEAGELDDLRDLNARWWAAWLHRYLYELHTDEMVERVEEVHANLVAALNWSVVDPELGLFLLAGLVRAWWGGGRAGDAMTAIDRLLTPPNAVAHPEAWIDAVTFAAGLVYTFRGQDEGDSLLGVAELMATSIDDEYRLALVRWYHFGNDLVGRLRELARQRGDRFVEAIAVMGEATLLVNDDPQRADDHLVDAREFADAERSSLLRDQVRECEVSAARDVGDLARGIATAEELARSRSTLTISNSVWLLASIGLLAADEEAVALAVRVAERRLPDLSGSNVELEQARARLRVLKGDARASVTAAFDSILWMNGSLWFVCREAIDAGEPELALAVARARAKPTAFGQAVLAAVESAVSGDEARWHDALRQAVDRGLRPIAVDALEGLAVGASRRGRWADCMRLFAAADRLREETGYRWRFQFEREVVEPARESALAALGAPPAEHALEWRAAAAHAARARGHRQRPRHGWESLTPTELQVAELVAEGHSNPQIAVRLLMGRATVKTHLEHVFTKLGVSSRAALAAVVAEHRPR
jgi:predicted ATPase/DNA-binding CsgD family transcriptional regulator